MIQAPQGGDMSEVKVKNTPKSKMKYIVLAIFILLIIASILLVPRYNRYLKAKRAKEIMTAMESIRLKVDQIWKTNGTISGITLQGILADAEINPKLQKKWQFAIAWKQTDIYTTEMVEKLKDVSTNETVYISPYRMILAVATKDNPLKEGTKLWFAGDSNTYHGFGVDDAVEPVWAEFFPNP
jgi:type II secretory pathway pseudopilin PulG